MKLFFTVTKKGIAVFLCAVTVLLIALLWSTSLKVSAIDGSTFQKRMVYIKSLNLEVEENAVTFKETVIPEVFGSVYTEYNKLQKKAGFDLSDYKGKAVTVYTYPLKGQNKNLTLIIYKGKIIGGDIADTALNGKMKPLNN